MKITADRNSLNGRWAISDDTGAIYGGRCFESEIAYNVWGNGFLCWIESHDGARPLDLPKNWIVV